MNNKNVIDFRFLSKNEYKDENYTNWSRMYEYPLIIQKIKETSKDTPLIHNTACGFAPIHEKFAKDLDKISNCIHSDILTDSPIQQQYYDLISEKKEFKNKFDYVLNISTLEHIKNLEIQILKNLYKQVKPNGYLLCTFDYPTVDLTKIEKFLNKKCQDVSDRLTNDMLKLNIILLTIQKKQ